jgi:hypothetical protein
VHHPFAVEHEVRQRQEDLMALAMATQAARRARARTEGGGIERGRRAVGRALVTLGVVVGLPRGRRRPAVEHAVALLEPERCLTCT